MEDNNDGLRCQVEGKPDLDLSSLGYPCRSPNTSIQSEPTCSWDAASRYRIRAASTTVAVVNQSFVKKFFKPGENPIGHHFGSGKHICTIMRLWAWWKIRFITDVRWKNHLMFFVRRCCKGQPAQNTDRPRRDDVCRRHRLKTAHPVPEHGNLSLAERFPASIRTSQW